MITCSSNQQSIQTTTDNQQPTINNLYNQPTLLVFANPPTFLAELKGDIWNTKPFEERDEALARAHSVLV